MTFIRLRTAILTASTAIAMQAVATAQVSYLQGHEDQIYAVTYTPDGKMLATACFDNTVRLWDRATGKPIRVFRDLSDILLAVSISPAVSQLAAAGQDRIVRVYDMPRREPVADIAGQPG